MTASYEVDLTKVPEYTAEAAKAGGSGDASLGMLFRRLSEAPAVTIAKLRGLTSADFDAELAEAYGWINRAVPDAEPDEFVAGVAARMGDFPRDALIATKAAVNAISLPTPAHVRADAALFQQLVRSAATRQRTAELFKRGFQTRGRTEVELGAVLGDLKAVD
ncbi:hypothetical protein [Streptomyces sp. 11-1-2]|uniref:enoyl-CoA hydratase/isomerase family protein n=1 Tax=unclassified Streptomyces TaxID=2593676 RepID=UPI0013C4DBA6|nr:hypothetical protein [Streptomyces sp. 11-1-2]